MKYKCFLLLIGIFLVGADVLADTVDRDGILRDDRGNVIWMTQAEAIEACTRHGMRLPTVRKLAELSQAQGAKGILEITEVKDQAIPGGYYLVDSKNPDGNIDQFYFNRDGYNTPGGDLGRKWFWSSSVGPSSGSGGYYSFGLNGNSGGIGTGNGGYDGLIARCFID